MLGRTITNSTTACVFLTNETLLARGAYANFRANVPFANPMKLAAFLTFPILASLGIAQSPAVQNPAPQNPPTQNPPASRPAEDFTTPRFATAISGRLRGLADAAAPALRDLKSGEPLIVVGKQGLLYEVEVPGGLTAWVYSAYCKDGKEAGTVETIEDGVNLRPEPRSDARAVPIARARRGQTFVMIERKGDWIKIVTPDDVHGFVLSSEVTITNDPPSKREAEIVAARRWVDDLRENAVKAEEARRAEEKKRLEEEAKRREEAARENSAREKLRLGTDLIRGLADDTARARAEAYFKSAEELAKDLPAKSIESIAAEITRGRERIQHLAFVESEKRTEEELLKKEREDKLKEAGDRQKRLEESYNKIKDPKPVDAFGARFSGMGWLRKERILGRSVAYYIERGGKLQFYVTCPTGRYNLDDYVGRELGLLGKVKQAEDLPARSIEVDQIEILSNFPG